MTTPDPTGFLQGLDHDVRDLCERVKRLENRPPLGEIVQRIQWADNDLDMVQEHCRDNPAAMRWLNAARCELSKALRVESGPVRSEPADATDTTDHALPSGPTLINEAEYADMLAETK